MRYHLCQLPTGGLQCQSYPGPEGVQVRGRNIPLILSSPSFTRGMYAALRITDPRKYQFIPAILSPTEYAQLMVTIFK
jgi:hypothetical protein